MNTLRFAFIIKEMEVRIKQSHGQGKLLPLSLLLLLLGAAAARSLGSRLSLCKVKEVGAGLRVLRPPLQLSTARQRRKGP